MPIFSKKWGENKENFSDIVTDYPIASGPINKKIELGKGIGLKKGSIIGRISIQLGRTNLIFRNKF